MRQVTLWTDGGGKTIAGIGSGYKIGAGIVAECEGHRKEWALELGNGTSQQSELLAIYEALDLLRDRAALHVTVITDSKYCWGVLTGHFEARCNLPIIRAILKRMAEFGRVDINWVKGHAEDLNNERADRLAGIGCGRITL